jgi:predicted nucleic acid-binding protein
MVRIAYSPLVEMECLVLPMRQQRVELIERFRDFFALNQRLSISDAVFSQATELRARHGLKTPDALHLATALHYGCTELWTNDDRLNKVAGGLAVNVLAW